MGRSFDPKEHAGGEGGNLLDKSGEYLLVCTRFTRDRAKSGKEYLLCTFKCIYGPMKDRTFMERIYLNPEALWKLGRMCESMQYEQPFDLDDDKEIREAICNRPFLGRVSVNKGKNSEGTSKTWANIEQFLMKLTDEQVDAINNWVAELEAKRDAGGDFSDDDDPDDPGPEPPDDFGDDDIPF